MMGTLSELAGTETVLQTAQRIEIKQGRTGNHRVFIAVAAGLPEDAADGVRKAVRSSGITCNTFCKGGHLVTITLVDDNEDQEQ